MNPFGQEAFAFQAGDDIASLIARAAAAEQSHGATLSLSSLLSQHEENRNADLHQDSLNFLPFSSMWDADPSLNQSPPQQQVQPALQPLRNYATSVTSPFIPQSYNTTALAGNTNHFTSLIGRSIQAKVESICDVGLVVSVEGLNPNGIKGILIFTASNPPPAQPVQLPQPPMPLSVPSPIISQTTLSTPTYTTIPQPIQHIQEEILIEPSSIPQRQPIPTVQPARVEQPDAESQAEQNLKSAGGIKKKYSKKEGKKRKYVKSGLYRKDKQGNFIFSSSDRARLAAMITGPEGAENAGSSQQTPMTTVVVDTTATQKEESSELANAFAVFCREQRPAISQQHSELSKEKLQLILSEQWKALPEAEKQKYSEQAEKELKAPSMPSSDFSASQRVKRPLNAYNIFCKLHFDEVKKEYPHLSINELSRLMGEKWKKLPEDDKKKYYDKVEHVPRYKKPLNSYNLFCKQYFETLKKIHPDKSINVLSKIIAEKWKTLPQEEKKKFYEEAERQKNAFSNKASGSDDNAQRVFEGEDDTDAIFSSFKLENDDSMIDVASQQFTSFL